MPAEPEAARSSVVLTAAEPPAAAILKTTGLAMEIAPSSPCWVSVTADGDAVFSGLMNAGDKRLVSAREQILINVGDAGAFAFTLNGRKGRPLGAPGQVVSRRITLSNAHEFNTP